MSADSKNLFLTTSWDDGDPLDYRVAELLAKYDIPGTFYVPCNNLEGRPVIGKQSLRELSRQFEIGSHTLDHQPVDGKNLDEIRHQVVSGKHELEKLLGQGVDLFCYPGGRNHVQSREIVRNAGFKAARTTADFNLQLSGDPYLIPTTAQFKPRSLRSFAFNFLKWGNYSRRLPMLTAAFTRKTLISQLHTMLDMALEKGGIFHLWGHSYQIEDLGLWGEMEEFLKLLGEKIPRENRLFNGDLLSHSTLNNKKSKLHKNEARMALRSNQ